MSNCSWNHWMFTFFRHLENIQSFDILHHLLELVCLTHLEYSSALSCQGNVFLVHSWTVLDCHLRNLFDCLLNMCTIHIPKYFMGNETLYFYQTFIYFTCFALIFHRTSTCTFICLCLMCF